MRHLSLVLLTASACCCPSDSASAARRQATADAATVVHDSAGRIATAYEANEVGADNKYLDRRVWVTGDVGLINQDMSSEDMVIGLRGTPRTELSLAFDKRWREAVGELRVGDEIEAECTGGGYHLLAVIMSDCDLKIMPDRRPTKRAK